MSSSNTANNNSNNDHNCNHRDELNKYIPNNHKNDPPYQSNNKFVGRYFINDDNNDHELFSPRLVGGWLPEGAKVLHGKDAGSVAFAEGEMYYVIPIPELGMCGYNLERHELPQSPDSNDLRKWIPAIEGFVDDTMSSYLPLSKKITRDIYCYNEENNAVLYQANHLVYPSEITRLEHVQTIHNHNWINLGYLTDRGVYEFIHSSECRLCCGYWGWINHWNW